MTSVSFWIEGHTRLLVMSFMRCIAIKGALSMLKYELSTALKSKRVMALFCFFILIIAYDLYSNYMENFGEYLRGAASKPTGNSLMHPCFASFLTAANIGHLPHILLTWTFPLYPLFAYADTFALQKQYGYYNVLLTKAERKKVVSSRFAVSFLIPFSISLTTLFLNFGVANIIFRGGTSFAKMELNLAKPITEDLEMFALLHPYVTYIAHILAFSLVAGMYGMFCAGVNFIIPKYSVLYTVSFFTWVVFMNIPYSVMNMLQSFAYDEGAIELIVPAVYYTLVVVATVAGTYIYKVRYDEL